MKTILVCECGWKGEPSEALLDDVNWQYVCPKCEKTITPTKAKK